MRRVSNLAELTELFTGWTRTEGNPRTGAGSRSDTAPTKTESRADVYQVDAVDDYRKTCISCLVTTRDSPVSAWSASAWPVLIHNLLFAKVL